MFQSMRELTDAEKMVIHYAVLTSCEDWGLLYKVAIGEERYNKMTHKSKVTSTSKWKNSEEVQKELRERQYDEHRKKEETRIKEEERRGGTERPNTPKPQEVEQINFLDRDDFLKFLNTRANAITDDKLRNDILKMLSDNMRYKEAEKDTENEIQRFYTPLICKDCPLYKAELSK